MDAGIMRRFRTLLEKVLPLILSDHQVQAEAQDRSMLVRLAVPYTFSPNLSLGDSLVAIAGCLARIFAACLLFAVWGALSALAWSSIGNHFWRAAAILPLILVFLAALATLMITITLIERMITPRR
jgi:hypothetical protein